MTENTGLTFLGMELKFFPVATVMAVASGGFPSRDTLQRWQSDTAFQAGVPGVPGLRRTRASIPEQRAGEARQPQDVGGGDGGRKLSQAGQELQTGSLVFPTGYLSSIPVDSRLGNLLSPG